MDDLIERYECELAALRARIRALESIIELLKGVRNRGA